MGRFDVKEKELQFLRLLVQDLQMSEIAYKMGKSPRTIDGYRDTLFRRYRLRSRVGLVIWALKNGVVRIKGINA